MIFISVKKILRWAVSVVGWVKQQAFRHAIKYLEKNGYRVEKVHDEASLTELNNATL